MDVQETVTIWISQLRTGDESATQHLWERYFERMVGLARRKLEGAKRGLADEEDVALSAFKSFCLGAQQGCFPQLRDRESLWPLLVAMTVNKSVDLIRHENRRKRGGTGQASTDSDSASPGRSETTDVEPLSELLSREPTPEFAAEIAELLEVLLKKLDAVEDPQLRLIALRKMQGESAAEIACDLGCVKRTVERKVQLIQRLWEEAAT